MLLRSHFHSWWSKKNFIPLARAEETERGRLRRCRGTSRFFVANSKYPPAVTRRSTWNLLSRIAAEPRLLGRQAGQREAEPLGRAHEPCRWEPLRQEPDDERPGNDDIGTPLPHCRPIPPIFVA